MNLINLTVTDVAGLDERQRGNYPKSSHIGFIQESEDQIWVRSGKFPPYSYRTSVFQ